MKKMPTLLVTILVTLLLPLTVTAQLQNTDFEEWIDYEPGDLFNFRPVGWDCFHRYLGTENETGSDWFILPPDSAAHNGDYAIQVSVWYNYTKDMAVQKAPIDYRPDVLRGFYKYRHNFLSVFEEEIDTAQISVYLWKRSPNSSVIDTIGRGILNIGDETLEYAEFQVDVEYFSDEIPDSVSVVLDPSLVGRYPARRYQSQDSYTSFLTVDNISLERRSNSFERVEAVSYHVYPNPATDQIHIPDFSGEVNIYDFAGRRMLADKLNLHQPLSLNAIPGGIYILSLNNGTLTQQTKIIKQ